MKQFTLNLDIFKFSKNKTIETLNVICTNIKKYQRKLY